MKGKKNGLKIAFFLITFFSCIRYNYGNDYTEYLAAFNDAHFSYSAIFHLNYSDRTEPGWLLISLLFKPFGFFSFVMALSIFENYVLYHFIKDNVPLRHQWIALAVYLFSFSLYMLGLSMMRQFLAMTLFVLAYSYMEKRRIITVLLISLIAISMHKTAVIFLPFVFLPWLPIKNGKILAAVIVGAFVVLLSSVNLTTSLFEVIISNEELEWYTRYVKDVDGSIFGKKYILMVIIFAFTCYCMTCKNLEDSRKIPLVLFSIYTVISPFYNISMVNRLGFYFLMFSIIAVPSIYETLRNKSIRLLFILCFFLLTFFEYFQYLSDPVWAKEYSEYHTILEAIL